MMSGWGQSLRDNLIRVTGKVQNAQAHHLLPQKFVTWFSDKGINIHDPKYGMWVEPKWHYENSYAWNLAWEKFKVAHQNATVQEIEKFAAELCAKHGVPNFLGF